MSVCAQSARVRAAIQRSLSEEISFSSSSSSFPGLSPDLKQHLAACAACAAEAAALDPTLLLVPLAASVSPEPATAGRRPVPPVSEDARAVEALVLDAVARRARLTPPASRGADVPARRSRRLAQLAAAVVLTAGLAGLVRWEWSRPSVASGERPTAAEAVVSLPSVPSEPPGPARPLIEGVRGSNARVYEFAAASPGEPTVVFVANPNADL